MSRKKRPYRRVESGRKIHKADCTALDIDGRVKYALTLGEARKLLERGFERCRVCQPSILAGVSGHA